MRLDLLRNDALLRIRKWCPDFVETSLGIIEVTHRSVTEYLMLPEAQRYLAGLAGRTFDPVDAIIRLRFVAWLAGYPNHRGGLLDSVINEVERAMMRNRWQARDLCALLDIFAESHLKGDTCTSSLVQRSTIDPPTSLPIFMQSKRGLLPNYVPVNFDSLTDRDESRAWFVAVAAMGSIVCVEQMWATVPAFQLQSVGIIVFYGLIAWLDIPLSRSTKVGHILFKMLLSSGLDLNARQRWKSRYPLQNTHPQDYDLTFWEICIRWSHRLFGAGVQTINHLRVIALLLDIASPNLACRFPRDHQTLLSVMKPDPGRKVDRKDGWTAHGPQLVTLLYVRGYLSDSEIRWARTERLIKEIGELPTWVFQIESLGKTPAARAPTASA